MANDAEKEFNQLKKRVEQLNTELAEARGIFRETKQRAKEEFGTSSIEELKEEYEKLQTRIDNLEEKIRKKADELDEKLAAIEEQDEQNEF